MQGHSSCSNVEPGPTHPPYSPPPLTMLTTLWLGRNSNTPSLAMTRKASLGPSWRYCSSGSANTPMRSAAGGVCICGWGGEGRKEGPFGRRDGGREEERELGMTMADKGTMCSAAVVCKTRGGRGGGEAEEIGQGVLKEYTQSSTLLQLCSLRKHTHALRRCAPHPPASPMLLRFPTPPAPGLPSHLCTTHPPTHLRRRCCSASLRPLPLACRHTPLHHPSPIPPPPPPAPSCLHTSAPPPPHLPTIPPPTCVAYAAREGRPWVHAVGEPQARRVAVILLLRGPAVNGGVLQGLTARRVGDKSRLQRSPRLSRKKRKW